MFLLYDQMNRIDNVKIINKAYRSAEREQGGDYLRDVFSLP